MSFEQQQGKVIFVGAGPGDPELITVKGASALSRAAVIIYDRLVSDELLALYANPEALLIRAGKQGGSAASIDQVHINNLIKEYAKQHKLVVRLKGGDVSVFSNILDELDTLVKEKIAYEIIPGITAASGAAAFAGIPLTAREFSNAVQFLSYHNASSIVDEQWRELAVTKSTLVFYMSANKLGEIISQLLKHGAPGNVEYAIIEQATTPNQFIIRGTIGCFKKLKKQLFKSPSIIIIGKVAALHDIYQWLDNKTSADLYFMNLTEGINKFKQDQITKSLVTC